MSCPLTALHGKKISDIAIAAGAQASHVDLSSIEGLADKILWACTLGKYCASLRGIDLPRNRLLTSKGFSSFCGGAGLLLRSLRYLELTDKSQRRNYRAKLMEFSLLSVAHHCSKVSILNMIVFMEISDNAIGIAGKGLRSQL